MELSRQTTMSIQELINQNGINTSFVHSTCCVCLDNVDAFSIIICGPCNHTMCDICTHKIMESNQQCPSCREEITNLSSLNNGLETPASFLQRTIFIIPPPPMFLKRQTSCGGSSRGGGGSDDEEYDSDIFKHMKLLPCHPVIEKANTLEDTQFNTLHSIPQDGLACFTMIASSQENIQSDDDIVIFLDKSGSMNGLPIEESKKAIILLIKNLKPSQRLSVVTFGDYITHIFPLQHVTPMNREQLIEKIDEILPYGGTIYTDSFEFSRKLFQESKRDSPPDRKQIMLFFSDGEPNYPPNFEIIRSLFTCFPTLVFNIISMGNNINASKMVPLLCDRSFELGRYIDCPNMTYFSSVLSTIVGDIVPTYATNIRVLFTGAIPSTSLAEKNQDGSYIVTVPILNINEAFNIAYFLIEDESFSISYSFVKNGEEITGLSVLDTIGILPLEISSHFPRSRKIKDIMNDIITNGTTSAPEKQILLRDLLSQLSIDILGVYFHELSQTIETIIQSLDLRNQHDTQVQNRGVSAIQRLGRQTSGQTTSRQISANIQQSTQSTQIVIDNDM